MLAFLKANYLTILIILVLVAIVVGIICSIVKDKKSRAQHLRRQLRPLRQRRLLPPAA